MSLFKWVVSFLLSLIMFVFTLSAAASYAGGFLANERGIEKVIEKTDVLSISAGDIPGLADELGIPPDTTVLDGIYGIAAAGGSELTREELRTIYEKSAASDFVNKQIAGVAGYLVTGRPPELPTADELKEVFRGSVELINEVAGIKLTEKDVDSINAGLDKAEPVLNVFSEAVEPRASDGVLPEPVKKFISPGAFALFISGAAVAAVLIFIVNRRLRFSLRWCGFSLLFSGLAFSAVIFILSSGMIFKSETIAKTFTESIFSAVSGDFYAVGALLCAAGLGLLLISFIMKKATL